MRSGPTTSIRPGSSIAAARAVGRSSAATNGPSGRRHAVDAVVGVSRRSAAADAAGPVTASKSRRSCSSPLSGRVEVARPGPSPPAVRRRAPPARSRSGRRTQALGALLGALAGHRRQALDERPELVLAEQPHDRVAVVVAEAGRLQVDLDGQVADDRREVLAHADLVHVLAQLVAELGRRDLVEAGQERIEVAELADQLGGGLLADPGHARDVVGRVALERLVVDHLVGAEPEALVDLRDVVHDRVLDARPGRHQPDPRRDQLEHVEVDGDDRRLEVVVRVELLDDRPDDVVRLVAGHLVDRDAERLDHLADLGELVAQVVGHARPGRLVLGVLLVAEGLAGQVERDRDVVGLEVGQAAQDDAREAEDAVHEVALGRRQGREGEVSAVDEPVAVEQHQAFHRQASDRDGTSENVLPVYP